MYCMYIHVYTNNSVYIYMQTFHILHVGIGMDDVYRYVLFTYIICMY